MAGAQLAQQFGGGPVGDAEADAQRVAGNCLPVLVPVPGSGPAGRHDECLVPAVLRLVPASRHCDGRPGADSSPAPLSSSAMRQGWRAARRSIMETATRNAAGGTAATMRPQPGLLCRAAARGRP